MPTEPPGTGEPPGPAEPPRDPRRRLGDHDTGRWVVTTRTSRYFLDLDTHQVMRHPGGATAEHAPLDGSSEDSTLEDSTLEDSALEDSAVEERHGRLPAAANLRGDGDVVGLRSLSQCRLGASLVLALDLRGDGMVTIRQSTEVIAIEAVPRAGPS